MYKYNTAESRENFNLLENVRRLLHLINCQMQQLDNAAVPIRCNRLYKTFT